MLRLPGRPIAAHHRLLAFGGNAVVAAVPGCAAAAGLVAGRDLGAESTARVADDAVARAEATITRADHRDEDNAAVRVAVDQAGDR